MLLLFFTVSCVLYGSSAGISFEDKCYGMDLLIPSTYTPPIYNGPLYFTPSKGSGRGSRKILMDNGEAKDPRLKVRFGSVRLTDLKETDEGTYSISFSERRSRDIIKLKILECADETMKYYGESYTFDINARTEYVEFKPLHSSDEPAVLWNRTNSKTHKGRLQFKWDQGKMASITPADAGYYNLRGKDSSLVSRKLLIVEGREEHYDRKVDEAVYIQYPFSSASWTVTYTLEEDNEEQVLMRTGIKVPEIYWKAPFTGRITFSEDGLEIYPLRPSDSGTFMIKDPQGNLALTAWLQVNPELAPTFVYVLIIVGAVVVVIICGCCVRKCCCKKSSSKRQEPPTAVYYHDQNQPTGPAYSAAPAADYSYQPANPLAFKAASASSSGPSVYKPVNVHVNPAPPEVAALRQQGASPALGGDSNFLSSDPEPMFEPKGINFATAPPLSSESAFCDVYTSDKLNFL